MIDHDHKNKSELRNKEFYRKLYSNEMAKLWPSG